ncbi:MG2 domain-containing protein [Chitinimonas lacunae]|uniref:MG2 domain-containing protein n=1 Tax=Chitinimonas lacunae TaxID=1963018 RepID=A0ABV8MKJ2_9NEIS
MRLSTQRQSELRRRATVLLFVLLGLLTTVFGAEPAWPPSRYQPLYGQPFLLFSEGGFSSRDEARVQLESVADDLLAYQGVDIALYRIAKPLDFLRQQPDPHRPQLDGDYQGEGLSNALSFLWDKAFKKSRQLLQRIFTVEARRSVVETAPELKQKPAAQRPLNLEQPPQYRPLAGFELVRRFRYPAHLLQAAPRVESNGEVRPARWPIPLGRLRPGLYLVEVMLGAQRALALVFVSDSLAVSKLSAGELSVWTASRQQGRPVAEVALLWSDGRGVVKQAESDRDGFAVLKHASPEKSYLFGQDRQGGVFVSENFYDARARQPNRLYLFTDRLHYRPGEWLHFKVFSRPVADLPASPGPSTLSLLDPAGRTLVSMPLTLHPLEGGDGSLPLPEGAPAGEYGLRLEDRGERYTLNFRLAEASPPPIEMALELDRDDFRVGEPVTGRLRLSYRDGRPLAGAPVTLVLQSQALPRGDEPAGLPVEWGKMPHQSDAEGIVRFSLPAAVEPSRYLLRVIASEYGVFSVSTRHEWLVQPAKPRYRIETAIEDQRLDLTLHPLTAGAPPATRWEAVRLTDHSRREGEVVAGRFSVAFTEPGDYRLFVRDERGVMLAQANHRVTGPDAKAPPLLIRADRARYAPGETARLTLSFAEPADDALLTLERDRVERHALLSSPKRWLRLRRLDPTTWQIDLPIEADYGPTALFSVLQVKNGRVQLQNQRIEVTLPQLALAIRHDRAVYRPGDRVDVEIAAQLDGKPVQAVLAAAVVEERAYRLQAESPPSISDFFLLPPHQVSVTTSLDFRPHQAAAINASLPGRLRRDVEPAPPPRQPLPQTAAWVPLLRTDEQGQARFSFTLPTVSARWRVMVRAVSTEGLVGQASPELISASPVTLRSISPLRYRVGDEPRIGLRIESDQAREASLSVKGLVEANRSLRLHAGVNTVELPLRLEHSGMLELQLDEDQRRLDQLTLPVTVEPLAWRAPYSRLIQSDTPLALPTDAAALRLTPLGRGQSPWSGWLDDLTGQPAGTVEQTASRLLALALAYEALPEGVAAARTRLGRQLQLTRGRLLGLSGSDGTFPWASGTGEADPFLTLYAHHVDWHASRALGMQVPSEHWQRLFDVYQRGVAQMVPLQRLVALSLLERMGLPVRTPFAGVEAALREEVPTGPATQHDSLVLGAPQSAEGRQLALLVWRDLGRRLGLAADPTLTARAEAAEVAWRERGGALRQILVEALSGRPDPVRLGRLLPEVEATAPALERSLVLIWLRPALQGAATPAWRPRGEWRAEHVGAGVVWRHNGSAPPTRIDSADSRPRALRLSYQTSEPGGRPLPVTLSRTLYRLEPGRPGRFRAVRSGAELEANSLYVDELVLTPRSGRTVRFGLAEVPLPPGAVLETQRTGFAIDGLKPLAGAEAGKTNAEATLGPARAQVFERHYTVPLAKLGRRTVLRQLVRFGQSGRFVLPAARFYPVYAPSERADEAALRPVWTIR